MVDAPVSPLERQQIEVTRAPSATYWHRVRFELVAREAASLGAGRILDLGAGSGLFGDWLAADRPELAYTFAESSAVLRDRLVERFGAAAEDDGSGPIPAGTLVAMLDVLEHIEDDHGMLATLRARMEPGSHLAVTVPAMQWAFSSWDSELGHFRRYSRHGLRDVITGAGLEVRSCGYLFPELFPLLAVRKLRRAPREQVDFPTLGRRVAGIGYGVASLTTAARRVVPFGTSVVAIASRPR